MTKEHYFMNFTKEQLAVKLEELDKSISVSVPAMRFW